LRGGDMGSRVMSHLQGAQLLSFLLVAPDQLVSELLQRLEDSVNMEEPPNPSILLAMNLAGATNGGTHKWLLQEMKEDVVKRAQKGMTSGQVALSVLALLSSCENPQHVHALGETVNLLHILQKKTEEEMASMEVNGVPKTTLFSLSLDTLGLCLGQVGHYEEASIALAKQVLSPTSELSVDTRAVAALAMACAYHQTDLGHLRHLLWEAVSVVTNDFLDEQEKRDGMMGNIYSMGLALQVEWVAPGPWPPGFYSRGSSRRFPTFLCRHWAPQKGFTLLGTLIQVDYSIINTLQGKHFKISTSVWVPEGSTLLKVLQAAEEKEPDVFSFQTEQTSWGPMVTSIHGLAANPEDRTYWQFLSGEDALQEGVGTYIPRDGEHIQAVFNTY
ncbi:IF factor, partial [Pedionomus torquatus]|nr:IF factor [Pedionomus torquatus]